ncbi:MAG: hypothetical protein QOJ23_5005, partial [Actinomycetota bacterium]|nr:hypothetical protein [Actinomycetota bacterium]
HATPASSSQESPGPVHASLRSSRPVPSEV